MSIFVPKNTGVDGRSLAKWVQQPGSEWPHKTLSTDGPGNHAVQSDRYRFYRYEEGSTELCDPREVPYEWRDLSGKDSMRKVIEDHASAIPTGDAKPS